MNYQKGTPKTDKIRFVDMSQELENVLREWRLACPISEYNLVFQNSDGNYLDVIWSNEDLNQL